jgi:putative transposase
MGKPKRITLDNSIYHITVRGNQKQTTFIDQADFARYEEILKHYKKKFKFKLYGYCLMPNHVHLILEIIKAKELAKIMQGLNLTYTLYFN